MKKIKYRVVHWKYMLKESIYKYKLPDGLELDLEKKEQVTGRYYMIFPKLIEIYHGFCWNGASGPTYDTENSLRATMLHDAMYLAMEEKRISTSRNRKTADRIFRMVLKEDGMGFMRRNIWYYAVRICGRKNMKTDFERYEVHINPMPIKGAPVEKDDKML